MEKVNRGNNTKGPTAGEITILASSPIEITENGISQKVMNDLHDCGFNACFCFISTDYLEETLSAGINAGIHLLWSNSMIWAPLESKDDPSKSWIHSTLQKAVDENKNYESVDKLTDQQKIDILKSAFINRIKYCSELYSSNEYCAGLNLQDEPTIDELNSKYDESNENIDDFITPQGSFYCLSNRYQLIQKSLPSSKVISVNLVGVPDKKYTGDTTEASYTTYLNAYAKNAGEGNKPYLWSYDFYPIKEKNALLRGEYGVISDNGKLTINYERFYKDLEIFRDRVKANGGVFWTYAQSMVWAIGSNYYPKSLEAYLRFEIFSSLAMGAQGVVYWTYHQRSNPKDNDALLLSALVNMSDRKTAAWYFAQKVNHEVKHFNFIFFDCTCEIWGHVGEIYSGCKMLTGSLGPISLRIETTGKGVLASYLTKRTDEGGISVNHHYIVIVSHDVENYQKIKIFFNQSYPIKELTPLRSGDPYPDSVIDIPSSGLERTLLPGGYLIYEWNVQM